MVFIYKFTRFISSIQDLRFSLPEVFLPELNRKESETPNLLIFSNSRSCKEASRPEITIFEHVRLVLKTSFMYIAKFRLLLKNDFLNPKYALHDDDTSA